VGLQVTRVLTLIPLYAPSVHICGLDSVLTLSLQKVLITLLTFIMNPMLKDHISEMKK